MIGVDNSALKYLEKFGLEVYCIDGDATEKTISDVKNLINDKKINYIYTFKNDKLSENATEIMKEFSNIKRQELHKLDNISDEQRANKENYDTLIVENLELLKQELYQ